LPSPWPSIAGLFNIGGEGQAYIGGHGLRRSPCLALDRYAALVCSMIPLAILGARRLLRRGSGRCHSRLGCRPGAAATSSSPPSCSTSWPPALMVYLMVNKC
jgi:hypothetical protein